MRHKVHVTECNTITDFPDAMKFGKGGKVTNIKRDVASFMFRMEEIFLSLSVLIGWQLSIWNCCKAFFSLLYNCQLLCFWRLALSIVVEVFPLPFFPDIAPSRMFTTNSLCLIVCPIHKWRLFLKIFRSNLSSFAL